tara:strand:- start:1056 stop:1682 length:627 start_codon:yes stop_codon:yes gene_type:complete
MVTTESLACWFNSFTITSEKYPFLADRLNHSLLLSQLQGKKWIGDELNNIGEHFENTAIVGGWFCHYLACVLDPYTDYMCNYDIDPYAVAISKTFNRYQEHKFTANVKDLNIDKFWKFHKQQGRIQLVVNTSCEHMHPFYLMKNNINKQLPKSPLYVLQSTDEDKYEDHINCVSCPEELEEQADFINVLYSGTKVLDNGMKRFMVIGR